MGIDKLSSLILFSFLRGVCCIRIEHLVCTDHVSWFNSYWFCMAFSAIEMIFNLSAASTRYLAKSKKQKAQNFK